MTVVLVLAVVLAAGLGAALVVGRWGREVDGLRAPTSTLSHVPLPVGEVEPADVEVLRFDRALRGYRMDQVDDVLDRLGEALADRDAQIARLTAPEPVGDGAAGPPAGSPSPAPSPVPEA